MQKVVFFFPSLSHFFTMAIYRRFSTDTAQDIKQSAHSKTCFSFKIKDETMLFQVEGILKNNLRLFKVDSKTLLMCHNATTSTNWWNMKATPTLILLEDSSVKIIGRGLLQSYSGLPHKVTQTSFIANCNIAQQKRFLKSHFSSFVIKQRGNSWKLRWVSK